LTTKRSTSHSTQHKSAPQADGEDKVKLVGLGHGPSKNKAWMGDMPVLGPAMVPALAPPGAKIDWEEVRGKMNVEKKVKLVKGGGSPKR
jgi:hypothetical protein